MPPRSRYEYNTIPEDANFFEFIASHPSSFFGDLDLVPMLPIVGSGFIMMTPILNWSKTVRKNDAHAVVVWWGILTFAAIIPIVIRNFGGIFPFITAAQLATCSLDAGPDCNYDYLVNNPVKIISKDFYNRWVYHNPSHVVLEG